MKVIQRMSLLLGLLLVSSLGQAASFQIDPGHSNIGFRIRHFVSKVTGNFNDYSGTIEFDEKNPASLKADAVIKTASINTSVVKRDEHLKSKDFFDVEKFPTITFKSTSVKVISKEQVELTGNFTMLGVTKPVTLTVSLGGTVKDPWGGLRTGFSATGKINRKDFGMNYNKTLDQGGVMLGDDVELMIDIEAVQQKAK